MKTLLKFWKQGSYCKEYDSYTPSLKRDLLISPVSTLSSKDGGMINWSWSSSKWWSFGSAKKPTCVCWVISWNFDSPAPRFLAKPAHCVCWSCLLSKNRWTAEVYGLRIRIRLASEVRYMARNTERTTMTINHLGISRYRLLGESSVHMLVFDWSCSLPAFCASPSQYHWRIWCGSACQTINKTNAANRLQIWKIY